MFVHRGMPLRGWTVPEDACFPNNSPPRQASAAETIDVISREPHICKENVGFFFELTFMRLELAWLLENKRCIRCS
jgi:hypothetical protein